MQQNEKKVAAVEHNLFNFYCIPWAILFHVRGAIELAVFG